jgi:hypothetical protein
MRASRRNLSRLPHWTMLESERPGASTTAAREPGGRALTRSQCPSRSSRSERRRVLRHDRVGPLVRDLLAQERPLITRRVSCRGCACGSVRALAAEGSHAATPTSRRRGLARGYALASAFSSGRTIFRGFLPEKRSHRSLARRASRARSWSSPIRSESSWARRAVRRRRHVLDRALPGRAMGPASPLSNAPRAGDPSRKAPGPGLCAGPTCVVGVRSVRALTDRRGRRSRRRPSPSGGTLRRTPSWSSPAGRTARA